MKIILAGILALAVTLSCTMDHGMLVMENGTLSGLAKVRDAYRTEDQADAGCEIYAIGEDEAKSAKYGDLKSVIERFQGYKYDYLLSIYHSLDPVRNNNMRSNYDTLSDITYKYISGFKKLRAIVRAETNLSGNYSLRLRPGKYYILYISGVVKSNNIAETTGNIGYKIVEIQSGKETIQNVIFQKYEMTGIMPVRNLSGC